MSQRLRALEAQVGSVLVERTRPVKPTSAGRLLLKHAKQLRLLRADLARELFRCELRWNAGWCGLELPLAPLDRPLRSGNAEAWLEAVQRCQAEVSRLQRQHSLSARVRRLMLSGVLMLQYLGEREAADRMEGAIASVIAAAPMS